MTASCSSDRGCDPLTAKLRASRRHVVRAADAEPVSVLTVCDPGGQPSPSPRLRVDANLDEPSGDAQQRTTPTPTAVNGREAPRSDLVGRSPAGVLVTALRLKRRVA